jgi:hypothetical protein
MIVKCIKEHYSPANHANLKLGDEYELVEIKMEHGVLYLTIDNLGRLVDVPAKYFWNKSIIREYFLQKILDN